MMRRTVVLLLAVAAAPVLSQEQAREPGVDVRIYQLGRSISKIPTLIDGQTPNVHFVAQTIDFEEERGDFRAPSDDYFLVHVSARLRVPAAGKYTFRLSSDDGSALYLDKKLVLDHDGLHGVTSVEVTLDLEKRDYELFIPHFENGGGSALKLEWRLQGQGGFRVLGAPECTAPKGIVRVTAPGVKRIKTKAVLTSPGDRRPLTGVHPSYDLATIRTNDFEPRVGGMDFLPDGSLIVCCWEPDGGVYRVTGIDGADDAKRSVTKFAHGLAEPLGIKVVNGRVFVLQKQELTELVDSDRDGVADEYRCIADGWNVSANFHEFAFGLVHRDGWLYFNLATAINPGGASTRPQVPDRGRTVRVRIEDGRTEFLTHGLRTPNGIGVGVDGEIFITDNQGDWLPVSKVLHLKTGAFYNGYAAVPAGWRAPKVTPPVVWLPQNEIGNSPSEPALFRAGPFAGQMMHGDVTHGGLKRVFVEKVGGEYQGAVFRFSQGMEAGINRVKARADGAIFVGGIGSSGNWGQEGKKRFGLQRLTANGEGSFEMLKVEARANGLLITFTEPLHARSALRAADMQVQRWRYVPTAAYGGPKVDTVTLQPRSVTTDGRRAFVELADMPPDHVYYVRLPVDLRSATARSLWSTEAWYTLNAVPTAAGKPFAVRTVVADNTLTDAEKAAGWTVLFDGKTPATSWRGFKAETFPAKGWIARDGMLVHVGGGGGGDIITRATYTDFEFTCEWRVRAAGNSGIMYLVSEDQGATWATGPEMQILDDEQHNDGGNPMTSAGAAYGLYPCARPAARAAGTWNHARVRVHKGKVEHWLNGVKVVSYDLDSDEFKQRKAASKFKDMARFAANRSGHIALQDHGDEVEFKNIFARKLK